MENASLTEVASLALLPAQSSQISRSASHEFTDIVPCSVVNFISILKLGTNHRGKWYIILSQSPPLERALNLRVARAVRTGFCLNFAILPSPHRRPAGLEE